MKKIISLLVIALMVISMMGVVNADSVSDAVTYITNKYPTQTLECKNLPNTISVGTSALLANDSTVSRGSSLIFESTLNMTDVQTLYTNILNDINTNAPSGVQNVMMDADVTGDFTIDITYDSNFSVPAMTKDGFTVLNEDLFDKDGIVVTSGTNSYQIKVFVKSGVKVSSLDTTKLADITYKLSGVTAPNTDGTYPVKIKMDGKVEFKSAANLLGTINFGSPETVRNVTVYTSSGSTGGGSGSSKPKVTSDKKDGTYPAGTEVKLSSNYSSAKIYYTTDGTEPTIDKNGNPQSTTKLYDEKIILNEDVTIKAIAAINNFKNISNIETFEYKVEGVDVLITPDSGIIKAGQEVVISSERGKYIYYTTDGTEPALDEDGNPTGTTKLYEGAIVLLEDTVVKAIAVDEEGNMSVIASEGYTLAYDLVTDHIAYIQGDDLGNFNPEMPVTRAEVATIFARITIKKMNVDYSTPASFSDVSEDDWYATAIAFMETAGIVNGYEDGTFRPNNFITRAEFAAIASRYDRLAEVTGLSFTDVTADHWAYKNINSAVEKGWVKGYEDSTFRPDENIKRTETVTVVNRMLGRNAEKEFKDADLTGLIMFPDNLSTHWAYYEVIESSNTHDVK